MDTWKKNRVKIDEAMLQENKGKKVFPF